jgi:hypothetical protein
MMPSNKIDDKKLTPAQQGNLEAFTTQLKNIVQKKSFSNKKLIQSFNSLLESAVLITLDEADACILNSKIDGEKTLFDKIGDLAEKLGMTNNVNYKSLFTRAQKIADTATPPRVSTPEARAAADPYDSDHEGNLYEEPFTRASAAGQPVTLDAQNYVTLESTSDTARTSRSNPELGTGVDYNDDGLYEEVTRRSSAPAALTGDKGEDSSQPGTVKKTDDKPTDASPRTLKRTGAKPMDPEALAELRARQAANSVEVPARRRPPPPTRPAPTLADAKANLSPVQGKGAAPEGRNQ